MGWLGGISYRFCDGDVYDHWEVTREKKEISIEVKGSLFVNESMVAGGLAVQGLGLVFNSEQALAPLVRSGKLELVLEPYYTRSDGYFIYFPSRAQVQPKLRAFIDYLTAARLEL